MVDSSAISMRQVNLASGSLVMIAKKNKFRIAVVEPDSHERELFRTALLVCDYGSVFVFPNYENALVALKENNFTHLLFQSNSMELQAEDFLERALQYSPRLTTVAMSKNLSADWVFQLIKKGLHGFLVMPYNLDTLEQSITLASSSDTNLAEAVYKSNNRNEAFAALLAASLDRYSLCATRVLVQEETQRALFRQVMRLKNIAHLAKTFAEGGEKELLNSIVETFISIANSNRPSKLAELRKSLKHKRTVSMRSK